MDHPYLVLFGNKSASGVGDSAEGETIDDHSSCVLCHESLTDPRRAQCGHSFCLSCVSDFLQVENAETAALCPVCQIPLSINLTEVEGSVTIPNPKSWGSAARKKTFLRQINVEKFQTSTKLEALMQVWLLLMKESWDYSGTLSDERK